MARGGPGNQSLLFKKLELYIYLLKRCTIDMAVYQECCSSSLTTFRLALRMHDGEI